jgi:restriction system protein
MDYEQLRRDLQWLRGEDGVVEPSQAEEVLGRILQPLLSLEGFDNFARLGGTRDDNGLDFQASNSSSEPGALKTIGIQYKHFGRGQPIGVESVHQVLDAGFLASHDRLMLIGRFGFTDAAFEAAQSREPVAVELVDLRDLGQWITRVEEEKPDSAQLFQLLIHSMSHKFATAVAADPTMLDHLEWRDLERMMARVMEGLGFKVTLTPPSKDGGKDLILKFTVNRDERSYIVELKHWRSNTRVGQPAVVDFLEVIVNEERSGGLFLSTSGYTSGAFAGLTEIERRQLRFGNRDKVLLLTQTYVRAASGLWSPPSQLTEVLFESTE